MANYYGTTRTNYFKVADEAKFRELIDRCAAEDCEEVSIFEMLNKNGERLFGFGCFGDILGICHSSEEDEDCDYDYDAFTSELSKLIPEGDAVIITHAGHEKLRYVGGGVTVITKGGVECEFLSNVGKNIARKLLNNPQWDTRDSY